MSWVAAAICSAHMTASVSIRHRRSEVHTVTLKECQYCHTLSADFANCENCGAPTTRQSLCSASISSNTLHPVARQPRPFVLGAGVPGLDHEAVPPPEP